MRSILNVALFFMALSNGRAAELKLHDLAKMPQRSRSLNAVHTEFMPVTVGGDARPAVFQHAAPPGKPSAELVFPDLKLPRAARLELRASIGIKDGDAVTRVSGVDGCEFVVRVNGQEMLRQIHTRQQWKAIAIDLSRFAGKTIALHLVVLPRANNSADWAAWAEPRVYVTDNQERVSEIAAEFGLSIPAHWPLAELARRPLPNRIARIHESDNATTIVAVSHPHLDLATALERERPNSPRPPVPLAPRLAVGEGAHPDNHTLVRVLNEYGVTEYQFLAFPSAVRGGVQIESIKSAKGEARIAASPINDTKSAEVRLFDRAGGLVKIIRPSKTIAPPYVITAEKVLAITSRKPGSPIALYSAEGEHLRSTPAVAGGGGPLQLTTTGDELRVFQSGSRVLTTISLATDERQTRDLKFLPAGRGVYPTAFGERHLWAGGPQPLVSHIYDIAPDNSYVGKDAGRDENTFWIALPKEFEQDLGPFRGKETARHIRLGVYGHIRVEGASPGYARPRFGETNANYWGGEPATAFFRSRGLLKPLDQQAVRMWNPCFSHRQFRRPFKEWALAVDGSGFKQFTMTGRTGTVDGYGDWDTDGFVSATYAPGATDLMRLYTGTLRGFLRGWAPLYRRHPSLVPGIEPNHEHEIAIASDRSIGDYHPAMITGFHDHLASRYGLDLEKWNRVFGTKFDTHFDAPRNRGRHEADDYSSENAFAREWLTYNREVLDQTLALTYREALLAGIPPEMIHCHQIPDRHAVGDVWHATVPRISGIDFAQTAGVGYGFTRFGTFSEKAANVLSGARDSGFDSVLMGEYQPLTQDSEAAWRHLEYVFTNGVRAIHPLYWGQTHSPKFKTDEGGFNRSVHASIQRLLDADPKRPGQAGGIGQVRPFKRGNQRFNLAVIGTGHDHTGLVKSLRPDGSFEGTVYAAPFHSHVTVHPLPVETTLGGATLGPLPELLPGTQIEMECMAREIPEAEPQFDVLNDDSRLPGLTAGLRLTGEWRHLRVTFRVSTTEPAKHSLRLSGCEIRNASATLQTDQISRLHPSPIPGHRHRGSINFAVMD
ncbi:MAG: hypothetical protein ISQ14_05570 [Verrucomicrobiae bacterium]|nr:hypothetical protein [Verrucomicrobiae bacterium]